MTDSEIDPGTNSGTSWRAWLTVGAVLAVLNASVTFHNIWPTVAVGWSGELSIELAVVLAGLILGHAWRGVASRRVRRSIAMLWLLLMLGRYVTVTAPALWGRELNFYWDLRFLPDVASMLAHAAPLWLVAVAVAVVVSVTAALYWLLRRAVSYLCDSIGVQSIRRALMLVAAALIIIFVADRAGVVRAPGLLFAPPVTATYARQVSFVVKAVRGTRSLPPGPSFEGDLSRAADADVLLFFIESYGAVVYERPEFNAPLLPHRAALEKAIAESGRDVVSAYVESPTFGGSSWFAHITLLSGIDVTDPDTNALLMTERRETMPKAFARRGYRTVAMLPAIWSPWPEGAFYGFQEIYNGERLHYTGPQFGWFSMSDQFVFAKLDALELAPSSRAPVFAFVPTISTHTPFVPTPPYQPMWPRMLTSNPYDQADTDRAYEETPDWTNLGPSYVGAVSYAYETLAGYIRQRAGRDYVMVLLGDHQPPALVSGEGAPWDVPVHVVTNRKDVLDRLIAHGFRSGLIPARPILGKMSALTPILLDALSDSNGR